MAAWRQAIELSLGDADVEKLRSITQSRTEPASRVERARILLAYREDPSFFAVGRALGLHHQTVQRCVERAVVEGPMAALDDRPRCLWSRKCRDTGRKSKHGLRSAAKRRCTSGIASDEYHSNALICAVLIRGRGRSCSATNSSRSRRRYSACLPRATSMGSPYGKLTGRSTRLADCPDVRNLFR